MKDIVWKCYASEQELKELNERYIISNLRHHGEQVELRIVSDEKPLPGAVRQDAALEDIYLYMTRNRGEER